MNAQQPSQSESPATALFGLCECGDKFPDVSTLMAHKLRHHMMEWPNVADAANRLRTNIAIQANKYVTVRRDDIETLLSFADKKPNDLAQEPAAKNSTSQ